MIWLRYEGDVPSCLANWLLFLSLRYVRSFSMPYGLAISTMRGKPFFAIWKWRGFRHAVREVRMTIPIRIRELRQERGLTLAQLAEMCSISTAHMSQIERGVKNLNNHLLDRLSAALGVQPHELILPPDSPAAASIRQIAQHLSPEDQARLLAFAKALRASGASE